MPHEFKNAAISPLLLITLFIACIQSTQVLCQDPEVSNASNYDQAIAMGFLFKVNRSFAYTDQLSKPLTQGPYGFGFGITRDDALTKQLFISSRLGLMISKYELEILMPNQAPRVVRVETTYLELPVKLAFVKYSTGARPTFAAGPIVRFELLNSGRTHNVFLALEAELGFEKRFKYLTIVPGLSFIYGKPYNGVALFLKLK